MKKWNVLAKTTAPDGGEVSLVEHDGDYTIRVNGVDLMSTREHASEERLAQLACESLRGESPRVLIGGLGFGFTLKSALQSCPSHCEIVVAEILEAIIEWNRTPEYGLAFEALGDSRVETLQRDVMLVLQDNPNGFDSIILDVDNGPAALTTAGNRSLYSESGLKTIYQGLRPAGVVAFWSSAESPGFASKLRKTGLEVVTHQARSRGHKGSVHSIYIGKKSKGRV